MSADRVVMTVVRFVSCVALVYACTGCTPAVAADTKEDKDYRDELAGCREDAKGKADACPLYVDCRKRVATKYSRPFSGKCTEPDK